jgi:hypothetical protein
LAIRVGGVGEAIGTKSVGVLERDAELVIVFEGVVGGFDLLQDWITICYF